MESANSHHHHHHLQDQLVASSSSSSPSSSSSSSSLTTSSNCYGLPSSTHANWTTPPPTSFFSYPNEATTLSSRETRQQENTTLLPPHYNSMAPEIGFTTWANSSTQNTFTTNDHCGQDLQQHSRIKDEELADHYYRKYTEILSSTSPSSSSPDDHHNDLGTKLLLKSFSSGNLINKIHLSQDQDHLYSHNSIAASNNGRGLCQIFPSVNVSSLNQTQGFASAGAFDMNLEAIDLLASSRFSANFVPSSHNQTGIFRDGFSFGFDHMQQSLQIPFYGSNNHKVSASSNAVVEPKRNCDKMETKALIQNAPKKSRLEARSSCPPFKVRKEKLGDRIAALQQLVAPFGKTDTASVLMEAIGYIKFLQSQVETLSVPYMKASQNKSNRVMKGGPIENENEETKRDLRSRGLCLVPLSCLSYITDGGGAAVWPPPHFGGAT